MTETQVSSPNETPRNKFWEHAIGKQRNQLSLMTFHTLTNRVAADRERILADRTPKTELATFYTQALKFKVTPANVLKAFKCLGIEFTARRAMPATAPKQPTPRTAGSADSAIAKAILAGLQAQITDLTSQVVSLRSRVSRLDSPKP